MSGVGVGTAGRYQAIMKTDNEELKQKVNTGEVPVGTAYREIKTRVCKVCGDILDDIPNVRHKYR